ncbi:hypothetical protein [Streptomyces decoyicus]|uniref:hypothetical protein n=1 Tax=Streptomyces decoyicus TaxID=249567 RepID=UPI00386B5D93|nr:hypothetical protein OG532_36410 [Streptomyces decoyicus]
MTHPEGRQQQAAISRLLLYYLNAPIAEGCHLRGVLPAPGAVRIAIHAGDDETFLYEIPLGSVAPACIPGILRTILSGTQIYSSDDIGDVMGMTLIRLHPERITPARDADPEPDPDSDPDPAPIPTPGPDRARRSASCAPCPTPATTRPPSSSAS